MILLEEKGEMSFSFPSFLINIYTKKMNLFIFGNYQADFFKIYFPTMVFGMLVGLFAIMLPGYEFGRNEIFAFIVAYLVDAGHVYTTYLESFLDKNERQKTHTLEWTLLAFVLNFLIISIMPQWFYFWIFYFTIFHNMRQGLGFVFLHQSKLPINANILKSIYYYLTMMPFIIFHFSPRQSLRLNEFLLRRIDLFNYIDHDLLISARLIFIIFYSITCILIFIYLWKVKIEAKTSLVFFTLVYITAFLILKNEMYAYATLIFSHGIPYFFLMKKRVELTHSIKHIKKYAALYLILLVALGAYVDFIEEDITGFENLWINNFAVALFFTPLIGHFLIDGVIWKRGHQKFDLLRQQMFKDNEKNHPAL